MALNNTAKNAMLSTLSTLATKMALSNASSVEISGGSPAYARKDVTWGTPANGAMAISNQPSFDVPAGAVVANVRFYGADGTTQYGDYAVTQETYGGQGTYTLTSFNLDLNK